MKTCRYKFCWILILFLVSIFFGCGSHCPLILRVYEGPIRPQKDIADIFIGFEMVIVEIDGVKTDFEKNCQPSCLEILPGAHTMTVDRVRLDEQCTIHFIVEADHSYDLSQWGNDVVLYDMTTISVLLPKPSAREVIVRSPKEGSGLRLISIDGNPYSYPIGAFGNFLVHLSPGEHKFQISIKEDGVKSASHGVEISGDLEAGCTYIIKPNVDFYSLRWDPKLVKVEQ